MSVKSLIDTAARLCGSQNALAERLGVRKQVVSAWRTGKELPSRENVAQMAVITGDDIAKSLLLLDVAALERTEQGRQLLEVMRDRFLAGAAATFGVFATLAVALIAMFPTTSEAQVRQSLDGISIVSRLRRWAGRVARFVYSPREHHPARRMQQTRVEQTTLAHGPSCRRGTAGLSGRNEVGTHGGSGLPVLWSSTHLSPPASASGTA